ncbi:hypothetical protein CT3_40160 [Comamonas terrigena NBRC 13299]|nr:hypothetical protein CT3_40160 [Comamonas terrigena NBRC 13299]
MHHIALQAESAQAQRGDHGKGSGSGVCQGIGHGKAFKTGAVPVAGHRQGRRQWQVLPPAQGNTAVARRCEAITKHGASVAQPYLQKKP